MITDPLWVPTAIPSHGNGWDSLRSRSLKGAICGRKGGNRLGPDLPDHARPRECFTWSQSRSFASPDSIRARRSSRILRCSSGTSIASTRPRRSSQIASITCSFSRRESFAISATVMTYQYPPIRHQSTSALDARLGPSQVPPITHHLFPIPDFSPPSGTSQL